MFLPPQLVCGLPAVRLPYGTTSNELSPNHGAWFCLLVLLHGCGRFKTCTVSIAQSDQRAGDLILSVKSPRAVTTISGSVSVAESGADGFLSVRNASLHGPMSNENARSIHTKANGVFNFSLKRGKSEAICIVWAHDIIWGHPSPEHLCALSVAYNHQSIRRKYTNSSRTPVKNATFGMKNGASGDLVMPFSSPSCPRQKWKERTYLVISKLQPFRRSWALFRMMPLSLPR